MANNNNIDFNREFKMFFYTYMPDKINPTLQEYFNATTEYANLKEVMERTHEDLTWLREAAQGKEGIIERMRAKGHQAAFDKLFEKFQEMSKAFKKPEYLDLERDKYVQECRRQFEIVQKWKEAEDEEGRANPTRTFAGYDIDEIKKALYLIKVHGVTKVEDLLSATNLKITYILNDYKSSHKEDGEIGIGKAFEILQAKLAELRKDLQEANKTYERAHRERLALEKTKEVQEYLKAYRQIPEQQSSGGGIVDEM